MQKEEYLIKNACYSVTKYYLCKRNNKRSLSGRKQRLEVVRSFPNRYQFSCINKVTSLFSNRYIFIIILQGVLLHIAVHFAANSPQTSGKHGLFQRKFVFSTIKNKAYFHPSKPS